MTVSQPGFTGHFYARFDRRFHNRLHSNRHRSYRDSSFRPLPLSPPHAKSRLICGVLGRPRGFQYAGGGSGRWEGVGCEQMFRCHEGGHGRGKISHQKIHSGIGLEELDVNLGWIWDGRTSTLNK